ncbi:hypothetical protein [Halopseudomonas bauzanensis]|uniref:hypothetical protein n=1 Tax=Halopseudomonas bauzanensis TaxID=653930 RepID=UPI001B7FAB27|nr:hypothetical protein [Halopseudomonas bauzanensis]
MQALLELLLPAALPPLTSAALVAVSALTSAITASLGIGGGVLLLAIMAIVMPPAAIIPVHGLGGQSSLYSCYAAYRPRG